MCHAFGILAGPKDGEAVFGGAEGFDSFVCLLAIVQAGGHPVDGEVWGADEGWGAPLGRFDAVVGFDVAIDFCTKSVGMGRDFGASAIPSRTRNPISFQSVRH